jgi:hypothetical protein
MNTNTRSRRRTHPSCPFCTIIPAHMLRALAQHDDDKVSGPALGSLLVSERLRGRRDAFTYLGAVTLANPTGTKRRTIYDAQKQPNLPGKLVRSENSPKNKKDRFVNEAYDYSGATYDFYEKVFGRKSIDGKGMRLDSTVHYRENATEAYDNAFLGREPDDLWRR